MDDRHGWLSMANRDFLVRSAYARNSLSCGLNVGSLPSKYPRNGDQWDLLFGYLTWTLWVRRNDGIFELHVVRRDLVLQQGIRLLKDSVAPIVVNREIAIHEAHLPSSGTWE
ncbi:hypothetical protein V6N11_017997 [Hibiscus sabdariffa]|uniref:Uncharacterized protein n=1 Tax=Hibiscus sabdariffa TaxID=183260 RepID=A0ABR2T626_9ROSI